MRIEWETQTVQLNSNEYRMLLGEEWEPCGVWRDEEYYPDYSHMVITKVLLKRLIGSSEPYPEVSQRDEWMK